MCQASARSVMLYVSEMVGVRHVVLYVSEMACVRHVSGVLCSMLVRW